MARFEHENKVRRKELKPEKKWNPPLFGIRNPLCWNPESSTRDPESTAWNQESKTGLDSLTWGGSLNIAYRNIVGCNPNRIGAFDKIVKYGRFATIKENFIFFFTLTKEILRLQFLSNYLSNFFFS